MGKESRRDYGAGAVFQRSDGMWIGRIESGWNASGRRRRIQVSAKDEEECKRRLVKKRRELEAHGVPDEGVSSQTTVKSWVEEWVEIRRGDLAASTHGTYSGALKKWVVPTIGKKRLANLTPGDLRAVTKAETDAGNKDSSARQTRRILFKCLRDAVVEGHAVPPRIFSVKFGEIAESDRDRIPPEDALAILVAALDLPHCSLWIVRFFEGVRRSEALGLEWDQIGDRMKVEWQLTNLPYLDRESGTFQHPKKTKPRHLWKSYHLVPTKTKRGKRGLPIVPIVAAALAQWRDIAPPSPYGLVWPREDGKPRSPQQDAAEWIALQDAAQVAHFDGKEGRRYEMHEIRHTTATLLLEAGVDPKVIQDILGHSTLTSTRGYQHVSNELAYDAMVQVAEKIGFSLPEPPVLAIESWADASR